MFSRGNGKIRTLRGGEYVGLYSEPSHSPSPHHARTHTPTTVIASLQLDEQGNSHKTLSQHSGAFNQQSQYVLGKSKVPGLIGISGFPACISGESGEEDKFPVPKGNIRI